MKQLQKMVERSLVAKQPKPTVVGSNSDFSLHCAVLDKVVVNDVFPDEIVEDLLNDILNESTGQTK